MTYNVLGGMLSLTQSINQSINLLDTLLYMAGGSKAVLFPDDPYRHSGTSEGRDRRRSRGGRRSSLVHFVHHIVGPRRCVDRSRAGSIRRVCQSSAESRRGPRRR